MKSFDITLCLIVKDEERFVSTCIESVLPYIESILIADTGSSDHTVAICKKYTDNIVSIDFSGGFSQARNYLLEKVHTKWVLFLDADEYFDESEINKLCLLINDLPGDVDALSLLRYNFFSGGGFYTSNTIKVFRSHPEIYYSGVVVDSIKPSLLRRGGGIIQAAVILNHFGHCRSIRERDAKSIKYLNMIDIELNQNPNNFKVMGYKGLILRTLGRLEDARIWSDRALELAPNEAHPHFVKGHIERAFGNHDLAVDAYSKALALNGEDPIYLNSRGVASLTRGALEEAEQDFIAGIQAFPHHVHFMINLGLVYQARGNLLKAVELFEKVGRSNPAFLQSDFRGCTEVDPRSGYIYDTIFNFRGLAYHWSYCSSKVSGLI